MRGVLTGLVLALAVVAGGVADAQKKRDLPYFASIKPDQARMRTGPGTNYPASWLYRRADLPVKVVEVYPGWKKVEDPDGTQGWMQQNLVSDTRTGIVVGTILEMRDTPRFAGKIVWRAAPGVVGRLSKCVRNWCYFDVHGRGGYVEQNRLWGVEAGEVF